MEDYCSYEVAKLLKEKGFDEPCRTYYEDKKFVDDVCTQYYQWNSKSSFGQISAPSHQVVMKWLRKEHHIHIGINPISRKDYYATIYDVADFDDYGIISTTKCFFHAEEVTEAAIKYCLENLI